MTNNLCDYGCGRPAIKTFKTGKSCCSANTSSCPAMKEKNSIAISKVWKEKGNNFWKDGHPRGSTNTIPWNKGLTKETDERVRRIGENVSASAHLYPRTFSEEGLESISYHARKNILSRYEDGWLPKSGRCKKYSYTSPIAGNINVDGTWELLFANWLDFKKFVWKRNKDRFKYQHLNGKDSFYTPDFWVEELGGYVEVKGYETDLDRCKWAQFPHPLKKIRVEDIEKIRQELIENSIYVEI